jgi:hypothetical protein
MVVRLCPLTKLEYDSLNKGMQVVMRKGKEWEVHGLPFALDFQAMILPQDEVI